MSTPLPLPLPRDGLPPCRPAPTEATTGKTTTVTSPAISLKQQTLDNKKQKVNDVDGNPIIIGAVVIWRVVDPTQAVFSVENYREFLNIQTDSTIRNVARLYPYDSLGEDADGDGVKEKTLRGSSQEIAQVMQQQLQSRVEKAGLEIEEVRLPIWPMRRRLPPLCSSVSRPPPLWPPGRRLWTELWVW